MSQHVQSRRLRAIDVAKRKAEGRKIIALTAYHATRRASSMPIAISSWWATRSAW